MYVRITGLAFIAIFSPLNILFLKKIPYARLRAANKISLNDTQLF